MKRPTTPLRTNVLNKLMYTLFFKTDGEVIKLLPIYPHKTDTKTSHILSKREQDQSSDMEQQPPVGNRK